MEALVTGASGYVGSQLLARLRRDGHGVRAFVRHPSRAPAGVPAHVGDAVTGAGLDAALAGCDAAYFLIHSMERAAGDDGAFADRERRAAEAFAAAASRAGVPRVVYLGGLVPARAAPSAHLASRLEVEQILLASVPEAVALRASIVIGAGSRSFRFLVRVVERLPVLALPSWRDNRTRPVDGRDAVEALARAAVSPEAAGRSLDLAGPDAVTYGELVERIRDHMLVGRPTIRVDLAATALASRVGAAIAGEEVELIAPLMEGLAHDLLPRPGADAAAVLALRPRRLDAAIERALRDWERREPLAAR